MGADKPKQYLTLGEHPILVHTLAQLQGPPKASLVLCLDSDDQWFQAEWVPFAAWQRVTGGIERMDSVLNALHAIPAQDDDIVMVHDVARPCITTDDLHALYQAVTHHTGGALLAMPVAVHETGQCRTAKYLYGTREGLWHALTPQGFHYGLLRQALESARHQKRMVTDEASAVEALGRQPQLVSGRRDNLKVTHPDDLALAAAILSAQSDTFTQEA